jgi:glycosyltransferase involved in cell wall biosynthesis
MTSDISETVRTGSSPLSGPPSRVSLIIPVFNSEATLLRLHEAIAASASSPAHDFEIVYVDDGSSDGSLAVLREIERRAANVRVVAHPRNRGQSRAVLTGIFAARSQIVVTLDDDLQHQPGDIPRLLAALENASPSTLVMGIADAIKRPLWRGCLAICANAISNLFLAKRLPLQLTTFCAFRKPLCVYFDPASDRDLPLTTALVQAAGATQTIPVRLQPSLRGRSRYGLNSLARLFLSRSGYYQLSKVLAWTAGALMLTIASAIALLTHGIAQHPVISTLLPSAAMIWMMLAALAIRVDRQTGATDILRANRPA